MNHTTLPKLSACAAMLFALGACTGPVIVGGSAAMIVATKPGAGAPADTEHQIPAHQSWCYKTMGEVQCYAHPQNVPPERLVNVDPQNLYPVDLKAYQAALDKDAAASAPPATPTNLIVQSTSSPVTVAPAPMAVQPVAPVVSKVLEPLPAKTAAHVVAPQPKSPAPPVPQVQAAPVPAPRAETLPAAQPAVPAPADNDMIDADPDDALKAE